MIYLIKAKEITISWPEGLINCDLPEKVIKFNGSDPWNKANAALSNMAKTIQNDDSCYEVYFEVHYENGMIHGDHYDLMQIDADFADIGMHLKHFCTFYSGRRCPPWMDEDKYQAIISRYKKEADMFKYLLDNYEMSIKNLSVVYKCYEKDTYSSPIKISKTPLEEKLNKSLI